MPRLPAGQTLVLLRHRQRPGDRRRRGGSGGHGRLRGRRRDRCGRPAGDLETGLFRPGPGGHRRAGRGAVPGHDGARYPAAGDLRSRRRAEVVVVRRLPAGAGLPHAGRTALAGTATAGQVRLRDDQPGRRRARVRENRTRGGAAQRRPAGWLDRFRSRPVIERVVTSGTFSLDGGTWNVDNNVWLIGDDAECAVIDAPHDADAILAAVGSRRLTAILCTHAHDDHVDAAAALADATHAPVWLHPADRVLWDRTYPYRAPDADL